MTGVQTCALPIYQIFTLANTASGANSSYTGTANVSGIATVSASLMSDASSFLAHTNRVSGVTSIYGQTDTNVNPYYQTATSYGKQAIMLVNQTDGITNNSPILGSMTSILIGPQINSGNTTISNDLITLTSGISGNNLSNAQVTQITTDITNLDSLLTTRQSSDVTFFGNVMTLVNNYNTTKQFSNMGDTETYLCNNFVGTPKLVTRINS